MDFIQNVPFFSILLSLGSGVLTSIMNRRIARLWNTFILTVISIMSAVFFPSARAACSGRFLPEITACG